MDGGLTLDGLASAFLGAVVSAAQAQGGLVASRRGVVLARTSQPGTDLPLRLPSSLLSQVLPGRVLALPDLAESCPESVAELGCRRVSVLCAPLIWGGRVQAVLYLERSIHKPFTEAEASVLLDGASRIKLSWPTAEGEFADELPPLYILLVEDNEVNRKVALAFLERAGHSVVVATDGFEAVDAVRNEDFDVILMDIRMPGLDGVEATRQIRAMADPRKARLPIIALTANFSPPEVERYMAAGMNGVLRKPLRKGSIEESLGPLFAVAAVPDTPPPDEEAPILDGERMAVLADAMDRDVLIDLIAAARDSISESRGELEAAWAAGDAYRVGRCAHRIAGVAANFGGEALARLARDIETDCRGGGSGAALQARFKDAADSLLSVLDDLCNGDMP